MSLLRAISPGSIASREFGVAQQAHCPRALESGLSEGALLLWKACPAQTFWSPVIADDEPVYVVLFAFGLYECLVQTCKPWDFF